MFIIVLILKKLLGTYLDWVVDLDIWVLEPEGSTVVGDDVRNLWLTNEFLDNFAELELSLLSLNSVWLESSLDVEENSEMFISLFNSNNVHHSEWESWISSELSINLNQTFFVLNDLSSFVSRESVLQSLLQKNAKRDAYSSLVWTSRWLGAINTVQFTEIPMLWCGNSFHNLSLSFIALNKSKDKVKNRFRTKADNNGVLPTILSNQETYHFVLDI